MTFRADFKTCAFGVSFERRSPPVTKTDLDHLDLEELEQLSPERQLLHPFTRSLQKEALLVEPEYTEMGTFFGMRVLYPTCRIVYTLTTDDGMILCAFSRKGEREGLKTPFRALRSFLQLAATPETGLRYAVARIKPNLREAHDPLSLQRLTQAYFRLFPARELQKDARGLVWIGGTADEYRNYLKSSSPQS